MNIQTFCNQIILQNYKGILESVWIINAVRGVGTMAAIPRNTLLHKYHIDAILFPKFWTSFVRLGTPSVYKH